MNDQLLQIKNIKKYYLNKKNIFSNKSKEYIKAVDGVSFSINRGEIFGIVGESGSGKTTITKLILLLEKATSGEIIFNGKNIYRFSKAELKDYRASAHAMFQDPFGSLDPHMRAGKIISEPLVENKRFSKKKIRQKMQDALGQVGLPHSSIHLYPHQFSGGQRQRLALARAIILRPIFLVLDEPVSALDVSVRAQMMNLLMDLHEALDMTYLLIAHDLSVVKHMCHRIAVMYVGKIMECADNAELYKHPLHPYTKALFSCILTPSITKKPC